MKLFKLSDTDTELLIRLFKENAKSYSRLYGKAIISMVVLAISTASSAWIMRSFVNKLFDLKHFNEILYVSFTIMAIFLIKGISTYFQILYLQRAGNRVMADAQRKLYNKLCQQSMSYFQDNSTSALLMRMTTSTNQMRAVLELLISTYVRDLISLLSLIGVMLYSNIYLSIAGIVIGPAVYFIVTIGLRKIRQIMVNEFGYFSQIMTVIQETTQGIKVIKAFSLENEMRNRMNEAITEVEKCSNLIGKLRAATSPIMETLAGFSIALICAISGYLMLKKGSTPGDLMAFITALLMAYEPAKRLANSSVSLKTDIVGVRLLFSILDAPITLKESPNAVEIPKLPEDGICLEFKDVTFTYPSLKDTNVLENISFSIKKGTTTALVGASGAGKSTVINLILRFYDPIKGAIYINNQNIKEVSFNSLHKQLAYVGQDTFLFQESVKYNISLGRQNATIDEIIEAAKIANAHEFIIKLPQGYNTILGAGGVELSGGQRQRIALSRAILRKSEILILDEATSALDSVSEKLIAQAIENIANDCTIIAIAHRFSTIINADNIIVFEKGRIIQQGNLNHLLKEKDSVFKHFYDLQFAEPLQGSQ